MKKLIITIDGPSGAGKSTIAKLLAEKLSYSYIDTGAMFRAVAFAFESKGCGVKFDEFIKRIDLRFEFGSETRVFLDGKELRDELRRPEISLLASELSKRREVREYLLRIQREAGKGGGIVIEGRDTGSVVFPDADIKFYLDARPEERARRRFLELKRKIPGVDFDRVLEEINIRDREDSSRDIAPLVVPDGAIYIDTSEMTVPDVLREILEHVARWR